MKYSFFVDDGYFFRAIPLVCAIDIQVAVVVNPIDEGTYLLIIIANDFILAAGIDFPQFVDAGRGFPYLVKFCDIKLIPFENVKEGFTFFDDAGDHLECLWLPDGGCSLLSCYMAEVAEESQERYANDDRYSRFSKEI